jgi:uncharacterized protein
MESNCYHYFMKIMIVSDTHGNYLAPLTLLNGSDAKILIHLGDEISDAMVIEPQLDIPLIKVPGNCDHRATEPRELFETIAGMKFLITHGDTYRVKFGLESIVRKAVEEKAAVALFGHTHTPCVHKQDGVLLVNPGTLMAGSDSKSYAILTITGRAVMAEIIHLP